MSAHLEEEVQDLKDAINKLVSTKPAAPNWSKWVGIAVSVIVLSAGIITSYATNAAAVEQLKKDQVKIEKVVEDAKEDIQEIQLKAVEESSYLKSVKEDVAEIKADVKTLLAK